MCESVDEAKLELVVARYQEDLSWLRKVPKRIKPIIYNKSEHSEDFEFPSQERLPNVGNEAHTYLHHITQRREYLADFTIFSQGHPFDHVSDFHSILREIATCKTFTNGFRWLGFIIDTDDAKGRLLFQNWSKNLKRELLDLDLFYEELFNRKSPKYFRFFPGAHFGVRREQILSKPHEFYEKALEMAFSFPHAAHCFERLWDQVFGLEFVTDEMVGEQKTVYLKPIKNLEPSSKR
ncbi:MAG: DUF3431 domain-containing protein [Verrucomicrobiota bacterium]